MKQVLRDALDDRGYNTLTPVQEAVLDPELQGRDLLVSAQTGSGKTVGFGLAIAPTLLDEADSFDRAGAPLGLIIAPTRELALQVKRELEWLFAKAGAVVASCVGGMDMRDERRALERGAHIVAATPGRLRDHIMRGSIDLTQLRAVVLDEADEMLDLGFREDLEFILGESPTERQTLMFSATVPKSISQLAQNYQNAAERVIAKSDTTQHADISYIAMSVAPNDTENAVINTLLYHKAPNAIVFANTRAMVNRLTTRLSNRGFQVVALSGELSQSERTHALQAMRDGRAQVCVATDVAARGIDLPNLDLVVHAELPSNHETMLHRSGRTGRAGRKGVSALVVTSRNQNKAQRILNMAKVKAEWEGAPSADAVNTREQERMLADESWQTPVANSEQDTVTQLQEKFAPEQLAAAYLRLYRSVRSTPEELSDVNAKPKPKAEFGASVWFSITGGREAGAEPRRLLPMLLKATDLSKDDIGAIRIQHNESYVQIRETSAATLRTNLSAKSELEPGAVMHELAQAPSFSNSKPGGHKPGGNPKWKKQPHSKGGKSGPDRGPSDKPKSAAPYKPKHDAGDKPSYAGGGKPKHAGKPSKPSYSDKPKPAQGGKSKTSYSDKPKPAYSDKPKSDYAGKPKSGYAGKPKTAGGGKPKSGAPSKPRTGPNDTPRRAGGFSKSAASDPSQSARSPKRRGADGPKGPPPPKGKASSKKNRARAAEARGSGGKGKGPRT